MARGSIIERARKNDKGEKVGTGHYSVIVSYNDMDGKRKQIWKSAPSMRQAEKLRTKLLSSVDNGTLAQPKGTLAEYLDRWLNEYAEATLSPTTAETYNKIAHAHIVPGLGKILLKDLKPEHLQRFYADRLGMGLSPTTIRHHHMLLHKALDHAVKWGLLVRNIADAVSPPHVVRTEMHILNNTEIEKIMSEARETPYFKLFVIALMTGLRRSELLGLRWSDINLILAELSVTRSLHRLSTGETIYRPPKTVKSRRTVALSPATCQIFREHLQNTMDLCSRLKIPFTDQRLVFCHIDGSPARPDTISQSWHRMTKRFGLNGIRFHDLRHTHASMLLSQNVHPKIVQERLGHSTIAVTLDTYSHVTPGLQRAAADKLDTFLGNSVSKPLATAIMSIK